MIEFLSTSKKKEKGKTIDKPDKCKLEIRNKVLIGKVILSNYSLEQTLKESYRFFTSVFLEGLIFPSMGIMVKSIRK